MYFKDMQIIHILHHAQGDVGRVTWYDYLFNGFRPSCKQSYFNIVKSVIFFKISSVFYSLFSKSEYTYIVINCLYNRSVWGTHERRCPRNNWLSYCGMCHTIIQKDKFSTHKDSNCVEQQYHTLTQHGLVVWTHIYNIGCVFSNIHV